MDHEFISNLLPPGDLGSIYGERDVIAADWFIAGTVNQPPQSLFL